MAEMQPVPAYMKRESDVPKLLGIIKKGGGTQGIERPLQVKLSRQSNFNNLSITDYHLGVVACVDKS